MSNNKNIQKREIEEKVHYVKTFFNNNLREAQIFNQITLNVQNNLESLQGYFLPKTIRNQSEEDFFLVARRFNSYTPAMPKEGYKGRRGGGYILSWAGKCIAIDPGYDFIENIYSQYLRISDINAVILTHMHQDHVSDFENILMLLYELNDKRSKKHTIDVFMNISTAEKYLGMIKNNKYVENIQILNRGTTLDLYNKIKLKVTKAKHREVGTDSDKYAIGLCFELHSENLATPFMLGITSDTRCYFDIQDVYKNVDLLIVHIGGVLQKELELESFDQPIKDMFYENHLGLLGTYTLLSETKAKAVILQEFGEELVSSVPILEKDNRILLADILEKLVSNKQKIKIIPGDIGLKVKIPKLEISCDGNKNECKRNIKFEDVNTDIDKATTDFAYRPLIYLCSKCYNKNHPTPEKLSQ